jgi:fructoselysine and glucoselysine-specific PTS system IIC component
LVLALPIASLAIFVRLLCLGVINPLLLHRADQYAESGNVRGVETMHVLGGLLIGITGGLVTAIAYVVGGPTVEAFLSVIPGFVQVGLGIATGIMPALGFAMLAKLLMTKELAVFFFLGFLVAAYLNFSMTGIALLGAIIAIILVNIGRKQRLSKSGTGKGGNSDDDF